MEPIPPSEPPSSERPERASALREGPATPPFVGRESQLAALHQALARSRRHPVVRVVDAPTGVGKSTLVGRFLHDLRASHPGAVALAGRYLARDDVRGGGLDGAVRALARHLAPLPGDVLEGLRPADVDALVRLFPVLTPVLGAAPVAPPPDPGEARRRGMAALRDLLARLAARSPVVLCLDDVQWSDADGAALAADLLHGLDAPRLLLVLACRRDDLSHTPVLERLLALTLDEHAPLDVGFVHLDALSRAETCALSDAVEGVRRSGALPAAAGRLLGVVAVAGRPLPRALALRAAEVAENEGDDALAVLDGLVRVGDALDVSHERVREAVLAGADPAALRAHHRRLADVLRSGPDPDCEAVAAHLVAAGEPDPAWCERAGDAAMRAFAFERAAHHYAAALGAGESRALRVKRAEALSAAGRGAEAAHEELAAAALGDPVSGQALRGDAALRLLVQGHADEGRAALVDALARIGLALPKSPWTALFSVVWRRAFLSLRGLRFRPRAEADLPARDLARVDTAWAAAVGLATFDPLRSAELHVRQLLLALHLGEPRRMARALSLELVHVAVAGSRRAVDADRLFAATRALVDDLSDPRVSLRHDVDRGIACFLLGRFREARALLEGADDALRLHPDGIGWERDNLARFLSRVLALQGDLPALSAYAAARVRCAEARGDANISLHLRLRTHPLLRLRDDAPDGVVAELDEQLAALARPGFPYPTFVHLVGAAEVELYRGDAAAAWNRVARTWPSLRKTMVLRVQVSRLEAAFLRGRCALAVLAGLPPKDGRRGRFEAIVWRERRALAGERVAWASALAMVLEAVEARLTGRGGEGAKLSEAATALEGCGMALHAACARLRAGEWNGCDDALARAWLRDQGVVDPDRFARLYVPGP